MKINNGKRKSFINSLFDSLFSFFQNLLKVLLHYVSSVEFHKKLISIIEKKAIKAVIKKIAITGGFKVWLVSFVVEELIEEADEHLIEPAFRKIGFMADTLEGAKVYKKVKDAEDVNQWANSLNNV